MPKTISKKKKSEEDAAAAAAAALLLKIEEASLRFKALGDPTRLRIVLFLRAAAQTAPVPFDKGVGEAAPEGTAESGAITVGAVALHLTGTDKVSSNISHHLKELRHAGLITMKRRGKNILCRIESPALEGLESLLCCSKSDEWLPMLDTTTTIEKAPARKRQSEATES
jgi:DNA-binding transcriptional ArsR family regulator